MEAIGKVYLLPMLLHEEGWDSLSSDLIHWIQKCDVFFVENDKTTRRFFKKVWKEMVIDEYEWFVIHQIEEAQVIHFKALLKAGKNIGIIAEAGCAGIADPGQLLIAEAQKLNAIVKPYVGPSSILLALMASGLNGQHFEFHGYLPIDAVERKKKIQAIEQKISTEGSTHLFIETPYRNNQLVEAILQNCRPNTKLCIGLNITAPNEVIKTAPISYWKENIPELHKKLAIFLLGK